MPPYCPRCRCCVQVPGPWVTHTAVQLHYKVRRARYPPLFWVSVICLNYSENCRKHFAYYCWFIRKNTTQEQPDGDIAEGKEVGRRKELPSAPGAPPSCTREAPKPCPSGVFTELLLGMHRWLNHWPEVRVGAERASPVVTWALGWPAPS